MLQAELFPLLIRSDQNNAGKHEKCWHYKLKSNLPQLPNLSDVNHELEVSKSFNPMSVKTGK